MNRKTVNQELRTITLISFGITVLERIYGNTRSHRILICYVISEIKWGFIILLFSIYLPLYIAFQNRDIN